MLGKSEEKEKVILLGMAVIDDSKDFEVGGDLHGKHTHGQGHSRECKSWKTMPRAELLKHLDSSER